MGDADHTQSADRAQDKRLREADAKTHTVVTIGERTGEAMVPLSRAEWYRLYMNQWMPPE